MYINAYRYVRNCTCCPQRPEEGTKSPKLSHCGCWEPNPSESITRTEPLSYAPALPINCLHAVYFPAVKTWISQERGV